MLTVSDATRSFIGSFPIFKNTILAQVQEKLSERGVAERNEGADNKAFSAFNSSLQSFIESNHLFGSLAIDIFTDLEKIVLDFEHQYNTQIHKGSIYFNAGLCCLWIGDFDKALYYWTVAGEENWLTRKNPDGNIFTEESFTKNLGQSIKLLVEGEIQKEQAIYQKISGKSFHYDEYGKYIQQIKSHDLKNMIVNYTKRIHYDSFRENQTTYLLYYRLVADFCITFETFIKNYFPGKKGLEGKTLGEIVNNDLPLGIKQKLPSVKAKSIQEFNLALSKLFTEIDAAEDKETLVAKILILITIIRNKVAHHVETNNILYGDIPTCQRVIRIIMIALLFDKYL